jgi:tetratricopeptide (TPR) repeat protein
VRRATCLFTSSTLLVAVLAAPLTALESPLAARLAITPADLAQIVAQPDSYAGSQVRFHAAWVGRGNIYDRFRSQFVPERHVNIVVWDDRADLSQPTQRAQAVATLYLDRNLPLVSSIGSLNLYEIVELTGRVESTQDGQPWITITELHSLAGAGAWTAAAIYHMEQARRLTAADPPPWDLIDEHYAAAAQDDLPVAARISVRVDRARALQSAARHAESAALLEEVLVIAETDRLLPVPELARIHALRAKALGETRQYTEAADHAATALRLDPSIGDAYAVYGIALAGLERYEDARRQCDKAVRLLPQDAEVRWYLGRILDLQGKHQDAIDALKSAIDLTPKDYRIHKALASAYLHRAESGTGNPAEDIYECLRRYDVAVRVNPIDGETYILWAKAIDLAAAKGYAVPVVGAVDAGAREPGTRELATARLAAGVAAAPRHIPLHEALAARATEDKRFDDAAGHHRDLVALEPASMPRAQALAAALTTAGRADDAVAALVGFHQRNPASEPGVVAAAQALADAGQRPVALDLLQRFIDAQDADDEAERLRDTLRAADKADAEAAARAARELPPPTEEPAAEPAPVPAPAP